MLCPVPVFYILLMEFTSARVGIAGIAPLRLHVIAAALFAKVTISYRAADDSALISSSV